MRLIGGGDDDVLAGAQPEALRHLAQVNIGFGARLGGVEEEEVLLHVLFVAVHLKGAGPHCTQHLECDNKNVRLFAPSSPLWGPVIASSEFVNERKT